MVDIRKGMASSWVTAGLVTLLGMVVGLLHAGRTLPPTVPDLQSSAVYDIAPVKAPVAAGFSLQLLSTLLSLSLVGSSGHVYLHDAITIRMRVTMQIRAWKQHRSG